MMAQEIPPQVSPREIEEAERRIRQLRWYTLGRELYRAAVYGASQRENILSRIAHDPTPERRRKGQTVRDYTATDRAGERGSQIVEACLLDELREAGHLGRDDPALVRHSAGMWLRGLFHESGLMRAITMRSDPGGSGGDPSRPQAYEVSDYAAGKLADYNRAIRAMETAVIVAPGQRDISGERKRRLAHAAREVACYDRWPHGFTAKLLRDAFDRLASLDGAEMGE